MVNDLLSIIDRLIRLKGYRERRFQSFFKEVLEPTFNDLLVVHSNYIEMFEETYRLLPKEPPPISRIVKVPRQRKPKAPPPPPPLRGLLSKRVRFPSSPTTKAKVILATADECPEYYARVRNAIEYLEQKRSEFEPVRDKLRTFAKVMNSTKLNPDVEAFVQALLIYFPNACLRFIGSSSAEVLDRIRYVSESALVSGSDYQGDEDQVSYILQFITSLRIEHRENWSKLCEAYAPLKLRASLTS